MINFYPLLKEYKEYMQVLYRSETTIKLHLFNLEKFTEYIDRFDLNDVRQITKHHIREYRKYRHHRINARNKRDTVTTQNNHLNSLRGFFGFLQRNGYVTHDPVAHEDNAKEPKRLPKSALTDKEVIQFLSCPDTNTLMGYRDRTIIEVLYSTGIRRKELLHLNLNDNDFNERIIRINDGKGGKDRIVPMGHIAKKYLENYIKGIRCEFFRADQEDALFLSKKGKRLSKSALADMIERYAKQSGIDKHITPHTFRRSCATEMIKNHANMVHVKDLLGHSSLESMSVYCDLTIMDLKKEHREHHPREMGR